MKNMKLFSLLMLLSIPLLVFSQGIDYTRSWLGTPFNGPEYPGNFIDKFEVSPDGVVHTYSGWDEYVTGGRNNNYKDGQLIDHKSFDIHTTEVTDKAGKKWTIMNIQDYKYTPGNDTIKCSDGRVITDAQGPRALAIANDGMLMVGEFGPRGQVRFYDISGTGTPSLHHTFGIEYGIYSGDTPGRSGPQRFHDIKGVGMDGAGNIYVGMSNFFGGCILQSYKPDGTLNWEVKNLIFVDNASFDPTTDGNDIYTKFNHFKMDYSKPAGKQWTDTAYLMNSQKYPEDARYHNMTWNPTVTVHPSSTWIRYKDNKKIMIVNDMFSEKVRWYRFDAATDGEIAIPSALYSTENVKPWCGNVHYIKINNDSINLIKDINTYETNPNFCENDGINQTDSWMAFCNIDFGASGINKFTASYSCVDPWLPNTLMLYADSLNGRLIDSLPCERTGSNQTYRLFSNSFSDTITGVHKVYMVRKNFSERGLWPKTQPAYGDWLWADGNGNGQMDEGEYQRQTPHANMKLQSFWVDNNLNFWILKLNEIIMIPCTGLDGHGSPMYNRAASVAVPAPAFIQSGEKDGRMVYDSDNDIMYLMSKTQVAKFSNWISNKSNPDWIVPTEGYNQSMAVAGDYIFLLMGKPEDVKVLKITDGTYMGVMKPGDKVNGTIDIPYGIQAMKRSDGEYIVLTEEDYLGKVMMYRFKNFLPNTAPTVSINKPTKDQEIVSASSIAVKATSADADGWVVKTNIYIDGALVSEKNSFAWLNASIGEHTIFARAFDNYGDSTTSEIIHVTITSTGVAKNAIGTLNIYPNPAKDVVNIQSSANSGKVIQYSIIDVNGRVVKLQKNTVDEGMSQISLSGIPAGMYILQIVSPNETSNHRLIIK